MSPDVNNTTESAPEKLLSVFSETRIVIWICVSVLVHLLLMTITSVGYVKDRWIDPEGAAARKALKATTAAVENTSAGTESPATQPLEKVPATNDGAIPEEAKNTPVVKRITEAASSSEIPEQPADIGISIDDTNPR